MVVDASIYEVGITNLNLGKNFLSELFKSQMSNFTNPLYSTHSIFYVCCFVVDFTMANSTSSASQKMFLNLSLISGRLFCWIVWNHLCRIFRIVVSSIEPAATEKVVVLLWVLLFSYKLYLYWVNCQWTTIQGCQNHPIMESNIIIISLCTVQWREFVILHGGKVSTTST